MGQRVNTWTGSLPNSDVTSLTAKAAAPSLAEAGPDGALPPVGAGRSRPPAPVGSSITEAGYQRGPSAPEARAAGRVGAVHGHGKRLVSPGHRAKIAGAAGARLRGFCPALPAGYAAVKAMVQLRRAGAGGYNPLMGLGGS